MSLNDDKGRPACSAFPVVDGGKYFIQNGNALPGVMTVKEYLRLKRSGRLAEVTKRQEEEDRKEEESRRSKSKSKSK